MNQFNFLADFSLSKYKNIFIQKMGDRFEKVSKNVILYIALMLNLPGILNFCRSSSKFNNVICKNPSFWVSKLAKDFGINYINIKNEYPEPKIYYERLEYIRKLKQEFNINYNDVGTDNPKIYYNFFKNNKEFINNPNKMAEIIGKEGNIDLFKYFLSKNRDKPRMHGIIIEYAAETGNENIVKYLLKDPSLLKYSLKGTSRGNQLKLLEYLISLDPNNLNIETWEYGLLGAAQGNHKDLVDFFISKGANNWDKSLVESVKHNQKDMIDFFISKNANLDISIIAASKVNNWDLVKKLLEIYQKDKNQRKINFIQWKFLINRSKNHNMKIVKYLEEQKQKEKLQTKYINI